MSVNNNYETCQGKCPVNGSVKALMENMPSDGKLLALADFFKVLGEHSRLRILSALCNCELCVCDLVELLGMNQPAISHQLRVLRAAKIVKYRKEGKNVFYSLDDEHVYTLMRDGLEHIAEKS